MESINMNVNLMKLSRVGVASIKGLKCVVIPIVENDIFISLNDNGKAKSAYLNITAWANLNGVNQFGNSHMVKQSFSEDFKKTHAEYCQNANILGNGKPVKSVSRVDDVHAEPVAPEESDLPF